MPRLVPHDRTPLRVVFWRHGVGVSIVLMALVGLAMRYAHIAVLAAVLAGFLAYTVWIVRRVWVTAFNVDNPLYGHIARALTVVWALNAVLVCLFLLLGRIAAERAGA